MYINIDFAFLYSDFVLQIIWEKKWFSNWSIPHPLTNAEFAVSVLIFLTKIWSCMWRVSCFCQENQWVHTTFCVFYFMLFYYYLIFDYEMCRMVCHEKLSKKVTKMAHTTIIYCTGTFLTCHTILSANGLGSEWQVAWRDMMYQT